MLFSWYWFVIYWSAYDVCFAQLRYIFAWQMHAMVVELDMLYAWHISYAIHRNNMNTDLSNLKFVDVYNLKEKQVTPSSIVKYDVDILMMNNFQKELWLILVSDFAF